MTKAMDLESALGLSDKAIKRAALETRALVLVPKPPSALALRDRPREGQEDRDDEPEVLQPAVGFGATRVRGGWKVAVRAWSEEDLASPATQWLLSEAKSEADVRVTGVVRAQVARATPAKRGGGGAGQYTALCRPLRAGHSVGHHLVTAGTLGAWVQRKNSKSGSLLMLSNNHVLANANAAKRGDSIVQPGPADDPTGTGGRVGTLHKFVRLRRRDNLVDAAIATVTSKFCPDDLRIPEIGAVRGWLKATASHEDFAGERVQKTGRTTGHRWGTIGAIVNDFPIDYGVGGARKIRRFNRIVEVHAVGARPFSDGGDSGSLVLDRQRYAVGLLFAGNGRTTYMNPIGPTLDMLGVELVQ